MLARSMGKNFLSQPETVYNSSFKLRFETTALVTSSKRRSRSRSSEASWGFELWGSIRDKSLHVFRLTAQTRVILRVPYLAMESTVKHLTMPELEAALDHLRDA